jgi:hypothetical protein
MSYKTINPFKATLYSKVDDVGALEPSSKPPARIVEDNVAVSLHQQRTPWMP